MKRIVAALTLVMCVFFVGGLALAQSRPNGRPPSSGGGGHVITPSPSSPSPSDTTSPEPTDTEGPPGDNGNDNEVEGRVVFPARPEGDRQERPSERGATQPSALPFTGSEILTIVVLGGGLMGFGTLVWVSARRKRASADPS